MIGIFDSGVGGLAAFSEVRRLLPREDIIYLADRKNAPYGTKTTEELKRLVAADIERLRDLGAEKVLIACCTASTVHGGLSEDLRGISLPIITPAAEAAVSVGDRIAVIATERTVASRAFSREINKIRQGSFVLELAKQPLVALIEGGARDGNITAECSKELESIRQELIGASIDALILGCTHFSHIERELHRLMPNVATVSPAREGARRLVSELKMNARPTERGRTVYT